MAPLTWLASATASPLPSDRARRRHCLICGLPRAVLSASLGREGDRHERRVDAGWKSPGPAIGHSGPRGMGIFNRHVLRLSQQLERHHPHGGSRSQSREERGPDPVKPDRAARASAGPEALRCAAVEGPRMCLCIGGDDGRWGCSRRRPMTATDCGLALMKKRRVTGGTRRERSARGSRFAAQGPSR